MYFDTYGFPKDPVFKEIWRKFCNRKKKWFPKRTSVICSDHFSPSCFQVLTHKKRILVEGAIPTSNNEEQNEKTVLSPPICQNVNYEQPRFEFMETSTVTQIKDQLRNKSKNVKRLQARNRYLRRKMDGLNQLITTLSNKSLSGKKEMNVVDESCASENSLERSNRMSIKQDETVVSNEFGLPECRTCLQALDANSVLVDLFQCWVPPWDGMESTIAEDLAKLANIQITQSDRYSKVICEPCCLKLQSACDFACSVRKNDRLLRQRFSPTPEKMENCNKTVWPKPIQLDKNINGSVYENVMDVEIKQEVLSEDEYTSHNAMEECREAELANLEIKIEPEELIQQQPMQIEKLEEHVKTITEQTQSDNTVLNGHLHDTKDNVIGLRNGIDSKTDIPKVKEEPVSDEDDKETIPTDLSLECMLCGKEFNSISGLKAHVIAQHSYKTVRRKTDKNSPEKRRRNHGFICGTCQRKFTTSTDLMVHETCHNKSVCYACSAKFNTFEQLTRHSRRCKAIVNKEVLKPKTLEDVKRIMKPRKKYTEEDLQNAITAIRNGCSVYKVSRDYNIPETTLRDKRDKKYCTGVLGKRTVLTKSEETKIVDWIHYLEKQGFPVSKKLLKQGVAKFVESLERPNTFKDGIPGKHWLANFLSRHPTVAKRVAQSLPTHRNKITEQDVRSWFDRVRSYFESNNLLDVLEDESRVYNCDETAFFLCPKEKDVLVKKGSKRMYNRVANDEKECLTVLVNISAGGEIAPPMVLYPYKILPKNLAMTIPPAWGVGCTESGWMNMEAFYEYVANVFYKWLLENKITMPVALFMDGHTSHISLPLSLFCKEKGIILVALLPNSNHLLQPLNVGVFRPIKGTWKNVVHEFRVKNNYAKLKRTDFAGEVKKCFEKSLKADTIKNSFKSAGIFPFGANNIDFSKVSEIRQHCK